MQSKAKPTGKAKHATCQLCHCVPARVKTADNSVDSLQDWLWWASGKLCCVRTHDKHHKDGSALFEDVECGAMPCSNRFWLCRIGCLVTATCTSTHTASSAACVCLYLVTQVTVNRPRSKLAASRAVRYRLAIPALLEHSL